MTAHIIASQGVHGAGSRAFTPEQYARIVDAIRTLDDGEVTTVADLSARTGVPGRCIREIVSAADGADFLLGGSGNGYQLARSAADAARLSARMQSQVDRMLDRLERRSRRREELT